MKQIIRNIVLGAVVLAWTGLVHAEDAAPAGSPKKTAPKGTPMQCEIVKVDAAAKTIEVAVSATPGDFTAFLVKESAKWSMLVKESGARPD